MVFIIINYYRSCYNILFKSDKKRKMVKFEQNKNNFPYRRRPIVQIIESGGGGESNSSSPTPLLGTMTVSSSSWRHRRSKSSQTASRSGGILWLFVMILLCLGQMLRRCDNFSATTLLAQSRIEVSRIYTLNPLEGFLVAAAGPDDGGVPPDDGAEPGFEPEEQCKGNDPTCNQFNAWVNNEVSDLLSIIINKPLYVETYDLSLAHKCDEKTDFDNIVEFAYACIYNVDNFQEPMKKRVGDQGQLAEPAEEFRELVVFNDFSDEDCNNAENREFCYRSSVNEALHGPCLIEYQKGFCARCKYGALRIFHMNGIFCGDVDFEEDKDDENAQAVYKTGEPDDTGLVTRLPGFNICEVDAYDVKEYSVDDSLNFQRNNRFVNSTTGIAETLCVQVDDKTNWYENCENRDQTISDETMFDATIDFNVELVQITIGCRVCDNDNLFFSFVEKDARNGADMHTCIDTRSEDDTENDICGNGEILQWEGILESDRELVCTDCAVLIPNCIQCNSSQNCQLCQAGYLRAEIKDALGQTNVVCLSQFCGFYGEGTSCKGAVSIEGCDRSAKLGFGITAYETCLRCQPGYYSVASENNAIANICVPQKDKVTYTFYVAPYDSTDLDLTKLTYSTDANSMNTQFKGRFIYDPIYSIQQALSNFQGDDSWIKSYSEAVVTIYLFKGVHHYINCLDKDDATFEDIESYKEAKSFLCVNYSESYQECTTPEDQPGVLKGPIGGGPAEVCQDILQYADQALFVPSLVSKPFISDNLQLVIKAMDCDYIDSYLLPEGHDETFKEAFFENCVDVKNDEKAQIRIANPYTQFNITGSAEFTNIEFTGEDMFASLVTQSDSENFMGQWGMLAYMPFTKCQVKENAEKLSTIDDIWIQKSDFVGVKSLEYVCTSDFEKSQNEPPMKEDDRCFPQEYHPQPISHQCTGEPYHEDFFKYSQANGYFPKRHKVLFNLYAFDPMRTSKIAPPELKIINCTFKFFVNKQDALIQVETNNLGVFGNLETSEDPDLPDTDTRSLVYYGEDRGAMITIEESEFYSNSFCKGLVYYNRFQSVVFDQYKQMLNFTSNFKGLDTEFNYDDDSENFIRIKSSTFKNTGFHQVISALNFKNQKIQRSEEYFIDTIAWKKFQNRGLVLNTRGYSGSIEVSGSTFEANIAYIQEILLREDQSTKDFFDLDDQELIQEYSDRDSTMLQFKVCRNNSWKSKYFFQDVIDPQKEFDDSGITGMVENVSTFFISGNRSPTIFVNNTFAENIGMTGGVVHIENPEFRFGFNPYIVMKQNRFLQNMAYWAGNVFHIEMNVRMYYGQEDGADSWQTCGNGILIDDNFFNENIGLKRHNGGAGVIRCIHDSTLPDENIFTNFSGKKRTLNSYQSQGHEISVLDDPSTHKSIVFDIFDSSIEYEVLTYGTWIKDNTFTNNYSGKRGTALLIEYVNELQIERNRFMSNGPVHAYREIINSPYYKHFLYNKRTLSYYLHDEASKSNFDCKDEATWFNRCYFENSEIDMPQVQGAVYVKNCYDELTCWIAPNDNGALASVTYEQFITFYKPWQSVKIKDNYFFDNHANIVMFASQVQPQASSLYIYGGTNTTISGNEFVGHRNWAEFYMRAYAQDVYRYMPPSYFKYSQSTIIRIQYPDQVYAEFLTKLPGITDRSVYTEISNNLIQDNLSMQVVTFSDLKYKASILEYDCKIQNATLSINNNKITRNQFIGKDSTLFYLNGGIASVDNNVISYNGMLTKTTRAQETAGFETEYSRSIFPWDDYLFQEAQEKGIFTIEFEYAEMPQNKAHSFQNNTFTHIYCKVGCAYHVTGKQIQQFSFINNTYNFMVSSTGAAVFYGDVDLAPSNALAQVWTQSYRNETFNRIFGGTIQLMGNNVPITFIDSSVFINNFGNLGAAINSLSGGGFFIQDSNFQSDYENDFIKNQLHYYGNAIRSSKEEIELITTIFDQVKQEIFSSYEDKIPQSFLFDQRIFDEEITPISNTYGQISLKDTQSAVLNVNQPVFGFGNQKMGELISTIYKIDLLTQYESSVRDSLFKYNFGQKSSAIYLDSSQLRLVGTNDNINFEYNSCVKGPTIQAVNSLVVQIAMNFRKNKGYQGSCYALDSNSELRDGSSSYSNNQAEQGGVIFAINDSKIRHSKCNFTENYAQDGAVLYAMYNSFTDSLRYVNCTFEGNFAEQNLIQLMSSKAYIEDSYFLNNAAAQVNHGITMITSELKFFSSKVEFSEGFADTLDLEKVDTAFFNLFLGSKVTIGNDTEIRNLQALNQAVLSAFSLSSVFVQDGVRFINNKALSRQGQTLSFQNTRDVEIKDAYFEGNPQINIFMELGTLEVKDSNFTQGSVNHISGISNSVIKLDHIRVYDSESRSPGHGFICKRCKAIDVQNSIFQNLTSNTAEGGAINIEELVDYNKEAMTSIIANNTFLGNTARNGGAILLDRVKLMEIHSNNFTRNNATNIFGMGNGGAILYRCNPETINGKYNCTVALTNNSFTDNEAGEKGGALRYENANFTDYIQESSSRDQSSSRRLQLSTGNSFTNNKATYGNDMGSFPKEIRYVVPDNDSGANIDQSEGKLEIAAGQEFIMDLVILDQEGRVYNDENQAIAKIVFVDGQELSQAAVLLGSDAVAKQGQFSFNAFKVRIRPSTSARVTMQFQGLDHFGTPIEFIDSWPIFEITARECVQGESYTDELSCKPCPTAFYLYDAQTEPGLCKECDQNAYCYGMNSTAPKPGYWRSGPTLETFTPCIRPESCLGGNQTDPLGQCDTGYKGILCNDCDSGYSRSGLDCNLCPSFVWNIVIFCALIIGLLLVIMFIVRSTLGGIETKKPLHQVFLKIFMNHFQVLAAVSQIDFKWPDLIQQILQSQQGVADGPTAILSVDCILMNLFPGGKPSLRLNYVRLIMFTCMPLIIQVVSFSFWACYGRCKRINAVERNDKATATSIIVLFLFYPSIVSILAKSINCTEIEGESRLFDDLEEVCYQGTHLLMVLSVAVPGLIAWAIGIPVYALIKLFTNVDDLRKIQKFSAGKQHEDLLRRFKVRLGFLTAGYTDDYFYWEIILLMRKTIMVLSIVFLSSVSSGVQSLCSILILTIFFMIHQKLQPYYDEQLNKMETLSLFVIILTIYSGLYYQAAEGEAIMDNQIVTWVIFGAVLIPSLLFAFLFMRKMWVEILKIALAKSASAFRFLTCGSIDVQQFKLDYLDDDGSDGEIIEDLEVKPKTSALVGSAFQKKDYTQFLQKDIEQRRIVKQKKKDEEIQEKREKARQLENESIQPSSQQIFLKQENLAKGFIEQMAIDIDEKMRQGAFDPDSQSVIESSEQSPRLIKQQKSSFRRQEVKDISKPIGTDQSDSIHQNQKDDWDLSQISGFISSNRNPQNNAFGSTQQIQKLQNFEYRDEIEFRGESVEDISELAKSKNNFEQTGNFNDDITKNSSLNQQPRSKVVSDDEVEDELDDGLQSSTQKLSFQNTASFSNKGGFGSMLQQVKELKEDDDGYLKSRNNQNRIKSGLERAAGITAAISKEDPYQTKKHLDRGSKRSRQVQSQLNPLTIAKLKRGDSMSESQVDDSAIDKKSVRSDPKSNDSRNNEFDSGIDEENKDLSQGKQQSKIGSKFGKKNIFKKMQKRERPNDNKKDLPSKSNREDYEVDVDDDEIQSEEGLGVPSIRGNTQRLSQTQNHQSRVSSAHPHQKKQPMGMLDDQRSAIPKKAVAAAAAPVKRADAIFERPKQFNFADAFSSSNEDVDGDYVSDDEHQ